MHNERPSTVNGLRFELSYRGLFDQARALSFPCDAVGHVDLDRLSERDRVNYLYARATVGLELARPIVLAAQ